MLVTIFLIVMTIYGSVKAPPTRGFSYIELWYIGVQIPILFALLEYGIMLAIIKYSGITTRMKQSQGKTFKSAGSYQIQSEFCKIISERNFNRFSGTFRAQISGIDY